MSVAVEPLPGVHVQQKGGLNSTTGGDIAKAIGEVATHEFAHWALDYTHPPDENRASNDIMQRNIQGDFTQQNYKFSGPDAAKLQKRCKDRHGDNSTSTGGGGAAGGGSGGLTCQTYSDPGGSGFSVRECSDGSWCTVWGLCGIGGGIGVGSGGGGGGGGGKGCDIMDVSCGGGPIGVPPKSRL